MFQRAGHHALRLLFAASLLVLPGASEERGISQGSAPQASPSEVSAETRKQSADYKIGVEDRLRISVWREPDLDRTVIVRPDGKITVPLIGDCAAAGRTPAELSQQIAGALSRYIRDPIVTVTVEEINHFKVYVLGEVNQQGVLQLRRRTRLLEALALAGGLTQFADKSKLVVIRDEGGREQRIEVDYRKIVNGEQPELNIYLKPGDTILVP